MNPPAAIQNAMGRERKPFTYTPGGLDLSEIKSERMARRLMRNAMSPGVQEVTSPSAQSPTAPPPAFPQAAHYNNLPVQVFPAFQLPANPKTLLRTRSTTNQPRESSIERVQPQYAYAPLNGSQLIRDTPLTILPPLPRRNSSELSPLATSNLGFNFPPRVSTPPSPHQTPQVAPPFATVQTHAQSGQPWTNGAEDAGRLTPSILLEPSLKMPSQILQSNTEDKKVKSKKKSPSKDADAEENVEVEATIKVTKPKKTISTAVEIERKILPDGTVEETKTTTTNTIINGKVEDSKVQKETRILSKEEAKAVIQEESEEEEEEVEEQEESSKTTSVQQNGEKESKTSSSESKTVTQKTITKTETKEEKKTNKPVEVKKPAVKEASPSEEEEEEEEAEKEERVEKVVIQKPKEPEPPKAESKPVKEESEEEDEEEEEVEEEVVEEKVVKEKVAEEKVVEETKTKTAQVNGVSQESEEEEEESEEEEEEESAKVEPKKQEPEREVASPVPAEKTETSAKEEVEETEETDEPEETEEPEESEEPEVEPEKPVAKPEQPKEQQDEKENVHIKTEKSETTKETITSTPVPEVHTTSKTETTEITSSVSDDTYGRPVSTQTELHRVENVVTVNRTTKSLDNSYEQLTQHGVPTVRTYFAPTRERISTSPQPAKPYTPTFAQERKPERRHSLLLDRLSTERQVAPPESYQNTYNYQSNQSNQSYETVTSNQFNQEPQSEVVNVSNVKPSSISNSQWYQTPQPTSNVLYNNVQPTTPQPQQQQSWQQPAYSDNAPYSAPTYQPEAPSYAPKPSAWGSSNLGNLDRLPSINAQSNQYSFMSNKNTTESYTQQSTVPQQYSTGYVPPPWESQPSPYYQAPSTAPAAAPSAVPSWNPPPQQTHSKPPPVSYQPPAPNASFVKQVTPGPKQTPGRKTYYSEYERRYISVPESTYIPAESKIQPQWDASPQYYYDNAEPAEEVEPPWRKELREFTEKSTKVEETTVIQQPWTDETKYPKNPSVTYTPQPTWSQTLRPRSWRERSFDSESLQQQTPQDWSKTSTLNRRPVSAFVKTRLDSPNLDRARGVSVDRYNANSYQPPASYAPATNNGYTLPWETQEQPQVVSPAPQQYSDVTASQTAGQPSKTYHNPQVPAYHVRSPTEPREYQISYQPRWSGQGRERPVQSRSFKYLQMLTGTEDGIEQPEPFVVQQPHHAIPRPRRV